MGEAGVFALKALTGERKKQTCEQITPNLVSPKENYIKKCDSDWVRVVRESLWEEGSTELTPMCCDSHVVSQGKERHFAITLL